MEGREGGQLHRFAANDGLADFVEDGFHESGGFGARQADLAVDGFGEVGASKCLSPHATVHPSSKSNKRYKRDGR